MTEIREIARNHWHEILSKVGIDQSLLDGKHHTCPACGEGNDCFRFDDLEGRGTWICNKCGAGDGFALLEKAKGYKFAEAAKFIEGVLNVKRDKPRQEQIKTVYFKTPTDVVNAWEGLTSASDKHPYLERKGIKSHVARQNGTELLVPVQCDLEGTVVSAQRILAQKNASGNDKFYVNGTDKKGNFCVLGEVNNADVVLFVEGFASGATVHEVTGKCTVVCFDAGNLYSVIKQFRKWITNGRFLICADNDVDGKGKARKCAKSFNCQWIVPNFSEFEEDESLNDFNDLASVAGSEIVGFQLRKGIEKTDSPDKKLVAKFVLRDGFVEFSSDPMEVEYRRICGHLEVVGTTHDGAGGGYGRLLEFTVGSGSKRQWVMPMRMLSGDCGKLVGSLMDMGLHVENPQSKADKTLIAQYINGQFTPDVLTTTESTGWHGKTFVLTSGEQIGEGGSVVFTGNQLHIYAKKGSLKGWQKKVASLAVGNSRIEFAMCLAFAGAVMPLSGDDGAGVNFFGETSTGKSTTQVAAGSVWGNPVQGEFISKWNSTATGMEVQAVQRNHTLFCIDELGEVDPKIAGRLIYQLASGVQKGRGRTSDNGVVEQAVSKTWLMPFISSAEKTLRQHVEEAGQRLYGGQSVRCVDVPADAGVGLGVFENVHGLLEKHGIHKKAGEEFAILIRDMCRKEHGTAGRAFVEELLKMGFSNALEFIKAKREVFAKCIPSDASGLARRAAKLFSLSAASGELAIHMGVLPWEAGSAHSAALRCFKDWLAENAGGNPEEQAAISQVRYFIEQYQQSRFTSWGGIDADIKIQKHAGWVDNRNDTGVTYYIKPEIFKREVCKGFSPKFVIGVLEKGGFLVCSSGHKTVLVKSKTTGKDTAFRVYAIKENVLNNED